jgi:hypothetical protein
MATNNTLFEFSNYTPNVFNNPSSMITTPYEQYPYLEHPSKTKAAMEGQIDGYGITLTTYNQEIPVYIPCMYNGLGDERYGIPEQEQPLDLCTDLLPSYPWSPQGKIKFQLSSVSNVARSYGFTIPDWFEFSFLSRDKGLLSFNHKKDPLFVNYTWQRSVSTNVGFLTIQFQGYVFNDLNLELRASTQSYGTAYSELGFANYTLDYKYCTAKQFLPQSKYSIEKLK